MYGYKEYKRDNDIFNSWLIQTAKDNGNNVQYTGEIDPVEARAGAIGRAKGKARKEAKKAAAAAAATRSDASEGSSERRITTDEARRQINFLASCKVMLVMPTRVWKAYKKCLAARVALNARYQADEHSNQQDNEGHAYYNKHVLGMFTEKLGQWIHIQDVPLSTAAADEPEDASTVLSNVFSKLDLENISDASPLLEEELDTADATLASPTTSQESTTYTVSFKKEEELRYEWFFFQLEMEKVKKHIENVWEQTNRAANPLVISAAAFLTDAALELLLYREEQIKEHASIINPSMDLTPKGEPGKMFHLTSRTLSDIAEVGKEDARYVFPLGKLTTRRQGFGLREEIDDCHIIQWMMDLKLDSDIRETIWETPNIKNFTPCEQPLVAASSDHISRTLQKINEGSVPTLNANLCAELLLSLRPVTPHADNTAFRKLQRFGNSLLTRVEALDKYRKLVPDCRTINEQFRTMMEWVCSMPMRDFKRQALQENLEDESKKSEMSGCWWPNFSSDFFRESNPALCGKLHMNMLVLFEELGLSMANNSPHIYAMAYLYTILKRRGLIGEKPWPSIETLTQRHSKELFLGKLPEDLVVIHGRMKVAAGMSASYLAMKKAEQTSGRPTGPLHSAKFSSKTWDMHTSPFLKILRDYTQGRQHLLPTLYSFDKAFQQELQSSTPETNRKSYIDDFGLIAFLDTLQPRLEEALARTKLDYMTVSCACSRLFQKMERDMPMSQIGKPATEEEWKTHTTKSFKILDALTKQLIFVESLPGEMERLRRLVDVPDENCPTTPLAVVAARVIKGYIADGGKGIPDDSE